MPIYNYADNNAAITAGGATLTFGGVIQRNDGHGGYNTTFGIAGSGRHYHVHFKGGSCKVKVIRYFSGGGGEGSNAIICDPAMSLRDLEADCAGYANHVALVQNIRAAIATAVRAANGELA